MDKITMTAALIVCVIFVVSLVLNVDFRAALLYPLGIRPLLAKHPGPELFGLDMDTAWIHELNAAYATQLERIRLDSPFPQLDRARLDLAYSRTLGKLIERHVLETIGHKL